MASNKAFTVIQLETDYYAILGVSVNATYEEIKLARNEQAMNNDPDKSQAADAHDKMRLINEAFEILGSIEDRRSYDSQRDFGGQTTRNTSNRNEKWKNAGSPPATRAGNEPWKRPPPPSTDGLGTGRYDTLGRQHVDGPRPNAEEARAAHLAAYKARMNAKKVLGERYGCLDERGRWNYHIGEY
ncbi:hypothetical protein SBOR_4049 [Sclerotinia borealis F-4128]|uniref:J domain-containing protein n=1 Tax=Sclerotinia borealis (strain F-4128) TaxID=1432307 RepID=W9CLN2_SCLBF|nr:hypothetical protein SBOR_4049 [Sclerotinia borealis F-4128]